MDLSFQRDRREYLHRARNRIFPSGRLTVKGKSLREHLEIVNHAEAIDFLREGIAERALTERLIKVVHHKLAAIHPFPDGNGRVGRLAMNVILLKAGYPPAIIRNEHRDHYYIALEKADHGDLQPIIDLIASEVERNLQAMLSV